MSADLRLIDIRDDLENYFMLWVVYERPTDYPSGYVTRLHVVGRGDRPSGPTEMAFVSPSLESVRERIPVGLTNLGRIPGDDPKIVETWV